MFRLSLKMASEVSSAVLSSGPNLLVGLTCNVHPVVLMMIIDSYERRNEDNRRVIGTLLGWLLMEHL